MMSVSVGSDVDRYHVEGVLGEGGMAVVYKVRHLELGTLHAMKVLHSAHPSTSERMLQEGRIQARVRHRNLVAVTDVVRVAGRPALVMEYIDGPPLDVLLYRFQPNLAQVDHLAHGILTGVAYAHAQGLIHRDLKPANVLVVVDGDEVVPKITDFGLAKVLGLEGGDLHHATRTGVTMGTPAFMAPEQFRDAKSVDERADVFSLGALLYEMVAGAPAYEAGSMVEVYEAMRDQRFRPVRSWVPSVPERMARAIEGALAFEPSERIPSCEALLAAWRGEDYAPIVPGNPWEPSHLDVVRDLATREEPWPEFEDQQPSTLTPSEITRLPAPPAAPNPTLSPGPQVAGAPDPDPPVRRRRLGPAMVLAGLVATTATAVGVLGLALVVMPMLPADTEPPPGPSGELIEDPAPLPQPRAEVSPASEPAPEPSVPEVVQPATRPVPAPAAPEPAHTVVVQRRPEPEPPAPEPAVAEPAPAATPEAPPAGHALVRVEGAERAYFVHDDGTKYPPGVLPAGTYKLVVLFDGTPTTVDDRVPLVSGEVRTVRCEAMLRKCQ